MPLSMSLEADPCFDWLEEELEGLLEVITVAWDNCAMFSCEALLKLMESEGDKLVETLGSKGFQFLDNFGRDEASEIVQKVKFRFSNDFCDTRGRETTRPAALEQLEKVKSEL